MKLVSKSTLNRFSGQSYSMLSMSELMGRNPYHIGGYIRLKKQFSMGLAAITEALGNVYMEEKGFSKLKDIDTYSFTWDVDVSQIPTVRFSRSYSGTPGNDPFTVYTEHDYLRPNEVYALENTQLIIVLTLPERVADGEFKCQVQYWSDGGLDTAYTQANKTLRYVYNMQQEYSDRGWVKQDYNTERHINYLSKIRVDQDYSGDFRSMEGKFFVTDADANKIGNAIKQNGSNAKNVNVDGGFKVFNLPSVEEQVVDAFIKAANGYLLMGRTTIDKETGRSRVQINGSEDIISGDGIIPQFERYAYYVDYPTNNLSISHFQRAIEYICDKRGMSQGNHITVVHNRRFSREKAKVLQGAINTFVPNNNGTWFFARDTKEVYGAKDMYDGARKLKQTKLPNEVTVGATFNSFVYEGNVITFVVDEALTNHYQDRGYGIFIDTGVYEDENGQIPAVHLKTLKGRAMLKNHVAGIGGVDGVSNGQVSQRGDYGTFTITGWRGACVRNPYGAVIVVENKA